jgi:type IV secretory pathway VirB10-like protein
MTQRPENFMAAGEDPEATLVAPRFDAAEERRAHPVVPLGEAPARTPYVNASRRRGPRRAWTPALLAVALLAAAALGGALATRFMQGPRTEQVQEQTPSAPVQAAEAPPPQPSTPAADEAPREVVPAARPATPEARPRHSKTGAAVAPAAVQPAREVAEDDEDGERRGKSAEKRRERDDEVEKEMRKQMDKAMRRAKGKAPRLVDVLTGP